VVATGSVGLVALVAFWMLETRSDHPVLPVSLFSSAQFSAANAVTFVVYGALGGTLFLVPLLLQRVQHYSPTAAGSSLLPISVVMLLLSSRMGRLATRIGPRLPMTVGPLVAAGGLVVLTQLAGSTHNLAVLLSGVTIFALGLSATVAPLTATVLAAAPAENAGVASAVNTDVARTAQLVAVAILPVAAGITSAAYLHALSFSAGFGRAMWIGAAVLAAGGVLAFITIRKPLVAIAPDRLSSCALDVPPAGHACLRESQAGEAPAV
jgi:predicted MFS family arabinose efflux permease